MECYNCGAETSTDFHLCDYCDEIEGIEMELENEN